MGILVFGIEELLLLLFMGWNKVGSSSLLRVVELLPSFLITTRNGTVPLEVVAQIILLRLLFGGETIRIKFW